MRRRRVPSLELTPASARLVLEPDVGDLLGGQHQRRVDDAAAARKPLRDAGHPEEQRRGPAPVVNLLGAPDAGSSTVWVKLTSTK